MKANGTIPCSAGDIRALFVEDLGWDIASGSHNVFLIAPGQIRRGWLTREERELRSRLRQHRFLVEPLARKLGTTLFLCTSSSWDELPVFNYRLRVHYHCRKWSPNPVVFYPAPDGSGGLWQWADRPEEGELPFERRIEGESEWNAWREELDGLAFSMDEEMHGITISDVTQRLKDVFWVSRRKRKLVYESLDPDRYKRFGEGAYRFAVFAANQDWPDWEEERTLGRLALEGRKWAKKRLFDTHLRTALEHARKIPQKRYKGGLEFDDVLSACLEGLRIAVERYDPERDVRLQSYASIWIRRYAGRLICTDSRLVDLPVHMCTALETADRQYEVTFDRLTQNLSRLPSEGEMLSHLPISASEWRYWPLFRQIHGNAGSFDERCYPSQMIYEPFEDRENVRLSAVLDLVDSLPEREGAIIRLRYLFGQMGYEKRLTLDEVASRVGVTRERARQIEHSAFGRLRGDKPMAMYARQKETASAGVSQR